METSNAWVPLEVQLVEWDVVFLDVRPDLFSSPVGKRTKLHDLISPVPGKYFGGSSLLRLRTPKASDPKVKTLNVLGHWDNFANMAAKVGVVIP